MKIAISSNNEKIANHFGRCEEYIVYSVNEKRIIRKNIIENPGHEPFFLPKFLKEKGIDVIITKGAGPRAINLCKEIGIKLFLTKDNECDIAIQKYIEGKLEEGNNICNH